MWPSEALDSSGASKVAACAAPCCAPTFSTCVWGFDNPAHEDHYLRYKCGSATSSTDRLLGLSCVTSLAGTALFFQGASWPLWVAIDAAKVLNIALLLSRARGGLWRHRDAIVCASRTATALAMVALILLGLSGPPPRSLVTAAVECQLVVVSCGLLRPLLYQVCGRLPPVYTACLPA